MTNKTNSEIPISRDQDLATAIRQRQVDLIIQMLFEGNPPKVKRGFHTETDLWDFKFNCPEPGKANFSKWAEIARHVLAFHNHKGGILFFGIRNDFSFLGATAKLDNKIVNDQIRKFLGDRIWVEFHREFIQEDQRYLGVLLIPPRGSTILRFICDAKNENGEFIFHKDESAIREGDSSKILSIENVELLERSETVLTVGQIYAVNEDFFRILRPEYKNFIDRPEPCKAVQEALVDPRTSVTALIGVGGAGKTALATWAALQAYEEKKFAFIISITAKDRALTASGIESLEPGLGNFESLLDNILEVLGFPDVKSESLEKKELEVRSLLENANGLLFIDNLETIDDARIIAFLDNLPIGMRAIVTSRRSTVRVSVRPIDLGSMTDQEALTFIQSLSLQAGLGYINELSNTERLQITRFCDGIPLAIRWTLSRANFAQEALAIARSVTGKGRHGDELLEFCFRRIFDDMTKAEKGILHVLSIFNQPMPIESILFSGIGSSRLELIDAIESLLSDALVHRLFDTDRNDYSYVLVPIARAFVYKEVNKLPKFEETVRKTLTDWFEAKDVPDSNERLLVRDIRQGKKASSEILLDLAHAHERRNDRKGAQDLYEKAMAANSRNWRTARLYGRFCEKTLRRRSEALTLYEKAATFAPSRGPERALIFKEWGLLLKDSGDPTATNQAIEKFEIALAETPNDTQIILPLLEMLDRKGMHRKVANVCEPLKNHKNKEVRKKILNYLVIALGKLNEMLKKEEIQNILSTLD